MPSVSGAAAAPQAPLTVTGAPTSAPQGSSFKVGTSGGSGTGTVTFGVSGGCANTGGIGQVAMTSATVLCGITATKAGDTNYEAITSAPVSVIATAAAGPGSFATLKAFSGPDGIDPAGPMVQMPDGWIYGLTVTRAGSGGATAFRFNPSDPAGTFATIWASAGGGGPGAYVGEGGLVRAADDNLYFVTTDGGPCNGGRIFRVTPPTTVAPIVDFYGCLNDGRLLNPGNGLTVGLDGALYGVATVGGVNGTGGLYRVGLDGALSTRTSFPAGQSGQRDALTAASDGWLYGTAANFSASFVYRVHPVSGAVETVQVLPSGFPRGRLLEVPPKPGHALAFVGVTQNGGTFNAGMVYRVDVAAGGTTFSTLHDFNVGAPTYLGETPAAGLIRAPDGTLYGTTAGYAGFLAGSYVGPGIPDSGELGTVFRIGADGVIAKLYGGPPLIQPFGPLLMGADGYLYGTSYVGDATAPLGSVFRVILPVGKTVPVLTWPTPLDIPYGTPLGATQLNATADVPGTFVYTPPAGTVLNVGPAQGLSVTFTPTDTNLYETTYASVLITVTKALQAPLTITGAPASAVYGTNFTIAVSGGSGTGAVSFAVSGACSNTAGGALITMTSGTGACSITATKATDSNYQAVTSAAVLVTAIKAAQAPLSLINAPATASYNTTFTVTASGGSGTGALSVTASGACSNTGGGALITMTNGTGTCTLSATKAGDANYLPATAAAVSVAAIKLIQAPLTVTGAPTSAPQGSSFKVGTSGGSGTGTVTFGVSGGCANTGGIGQVAMTSATVLCGITATKAGDTNYEAITSAPVSVIATAAAGPGSFATLKAFSGPDGIDPAGPMVQMPDGWIYGLTVTRAGSGGATAFRFNPSDPAGTFATIWASAGGGGPGAYVGEGGLVRAADDNLYFVTTDGGPCNGGRIFRVTPPTTVAPIVDFYGCLNDGRLLNPGNGLTVGLDGALYGVATVGGVNGTGGLYRVGLDGALSTRTSFPAGQSGQRDALTAASDGWLYGTAANFSASFVYRVHPVSGAVETVQVLPSGFPRGRLLEVPPKPGHALAFVGVTQNGGTFNAGMVYRVDVAAGGTTFAALHDFNVGAPTYLGETPAAGLIRAPDGTLYGTTAGYAGFLAGSYVGPGIPDSGELGTVFRIGADGVIAKLYGGPPLIQPFGPLLMGADGYLYGTSYVGDATAPLGSVFRVILSGGASAPGTPTGVTGARGNAQVAVSFTPPANNGGPPITSYTATASPGGATATGTGSPLTVTGLTNGTAYTFTVTATNAVGTSPPSAASAPVTPATVPSAPTSVSAIGGIAQATVSFIAPSSNGGDAITSYTVTASPGSASVTGSASPITVTGLTNGTAYTFTVRATNGVGSSAPSTASNAVTPTAVPGTPVNFAVTASGLSILGTWTSIGAAPTAHTLQVATSAAFTAIVFSLPLDAASSFSLDAPPGTVGTFFFRVIATNSFGSSAPTAAVGVAVPGPITPPGPPVLQTAVVAGNNVALNWTPGAGGAPSSYLLLVGSSSGASNVGTFLMGTFTAISSSAPNGRYFARVQASNAGGSVISNEISFTVGTPCVAPTAPTSPTVSRSGNTITVSWGPPATGSGPFSYTIVAGTSAGASNLGLFPVGSVTTVSSGVPPGSYFLRVRATDACGVSGDSVEVSVAVP